MTVQFHVRNRLFVRCWLGIALVVAALHPSSGQPNRRWWPMARSRTDLMHADELEAFRTRGLGPRTRAIAASASFEPPPGRGRARWQSDDLTLVPETDYRLEGWVRSAQGEARLGIDLVDADGRVVQSISTPPVHEVDAIGATWQWNSRPTLRRPRFGLPPREPPIWTTWRWRRRPSRYMGNRDVQSDAKGRIGFWSEEKDESRSPRAIAAEPTAATRPSNGVTCRACWWRAAPIGMPCRASTTACRRSPTRFSFPAGPAQTVRQSPDSGLLDGRHAKSVACRRRRRSSGQRLAADHT